jgi:hypothetical protein
MEWILLLAVAVVAALYVAWPSNDLPLVDDSEPDRLRERRNALLKELNELNSDLGLGRISEEDQLAGRRLMAPELRSVTEQLRDLGEPLEVTP